MATLPQTNAVRQSGQSVSTQGSPLRRARKHLAKVRINGVIAIAALSSTLALVTAAECHSVFYRPSLMYGFVLWGWWGVLGTAMWKAGERNRKALSFTPRALGAHLLLACLLGVMHLVLLSSLDFTVPGWQRFGSVYKVSTSLLQINRYGIEILIYGFVLGIIGVVRLQLRSQQDAVQAIELQRQLSAAHLLALQMQLEPHFLFNTLNAITTLVELGRQKEAVAMLAHLNAILKSTLKRNTPEKVPLSQELEIVENYLAIEQVRFADRLRIEMKVERDALDSMVPCFLLQPIVENAIRHGIANCEDDGLVEAVARREGNLLHLEVRDSGSNFQGPAKPGNGIGLKNTRERLAHFYEGAYTMRAQPRETGGFAVTITIPYERRVSAAE